MLVTQILVEARPFSDSRPLRSTSCILSFPQETCQSRGLQAFFEAASSDTTSQSSPVLSPSAQTDKLWKVVGGNTGGVLVREGCPLTSTELGRLSTGSLVQEWGYVVVAEHYRLAAVRCHETLIGNPDHQRQIALPEAVW